MYTLKGTIKVIGDVKQITDSFKKREFVVADKSGKYEQPIQMQLSQDNCAAIDSFKVGEEVEVTFFLRGKEYTSPKDGSVKYFNSLDAWKIDYAGKHATDLQGAANLIDQKIAAESDDLPF